MGATILKIDTTVNKPLSEKQKVFLKKLEAAPIMTDKDYKEYQKLSKALGKWKI